MSKAIELLTLALDPRNGDDAHEQRVEQLRAEFRNQPPSPLVTQLGLDECEVQVAFFLAGIVTDARIRRLTASIEQTTSGDPTLSMIQRTVYGMSPARGLRALSATGKLRTLRIIERSDNGGRELHEHLQTWTIAPRVLALLHGDVELDPALGASIPTAPALESLAIEPSVVAEVRDALAHDGVIAVAGTPGLGRRSLLVALAREAGIDILQVDALTKENAACVARECLLLGRTPLIVGADAAPPEAIRELLALVPGRVLATTRADAAIAWGRPAIVVEVPVPSTTLRRQLWRQALGQGTSDDAAILANLYPLAPALVVRAAEAALARARDRALRPTDLQLAVRGVTDDRLGQFATRVRTTQQWSDLVLARDQRHAVRELIARFRERGRVYEEWGFAKLGRGLGVTALFSGPPGTGKSMCAGLIAQDLGVDLYQVDASRITSKWIGETEKNLAALFDAAEASHAMLLFDEADALFGKRTSQQSSNDRHANAETNYLLQRIESYRGFCILTSNHATNIDPAFQRRLTLHLRFELPDEDERAAIWRAVFPTSAPLDAAVDLAALARRYDMSGGYIRNAALRAAFLAASARTSIGQTQLEHAARIEYEGMGKIARVA